MMKKAFIRREVKRKSNITDLYINIYIYIYVCVYIYIHI